MVTLATAALADAALGLFVDKAAGGALNAVKARLTGRAARRELAEIVSKALDAAAGVLPTIADDLRDAEFVTTVVTPTVAELVGDPTRLPDPNGLATSFVELHMGMQATRSDGDEVLRRIFASDRTHLVRAFAAFFDSLRRGMLRSEAWRDVAHLQATEAIGSDVAELLRVSRPSLAAPAADIDAARRDARLGSTDLREWPRDVWGSQIERPEFEALLARVREEPSGATLVVGEGGAGKSALLSALVERIEADGGSVFGIKADRLPVEIRTFADLSRALGMDGQVDAALLALARVGPVVLVIDQLDAVSEVMDRSSDRMRILLQLVDAMHPARRRGDRLPVHVIVSSRPFEADHDARFARLDAERLQLALPSREQVDTLLRDVGVDPVALPPALAETVRRPFALGLFVDLVKRGAPVDDLLPAQLLARWLDGAALGDGPARAAVVDVLVALADDMVATESLWRPVDGYELRHPDAVRRAVAAGLLIRDDGRISFSHQSWLDDFQAKGFRDGRQLAEFAWRGQDGLFPRASVLRGLQRLRQFDSDEYLVSLDLLLGDGRTRRHLHHLVVDLVTIQPEPMPREVGWVERLLREDAPLARRAVARMTAGWSTWRVVALGWLPMLMHTPDLRGVAAAVLAAEAVFDLGSVLDLIDRHWPDAEHDADVLSLFDMARCWDGRIAERTTLALERSGEAAHLVSHLSHRLWEEGRSEDAVELVALRLEALGVERGWKTDLYEVEKIAEAAPLAFARRLLPGFVRLAGLDTGGGEDRRDTFLASPRLGWDWRYDERGSPFEALRLALRLSAERHPDELAALLRPHWLVELEAVQSTIADALAAGCPALSAEGLAFLLDDPRRFDIGDANGDCVDGVGRTVMGWSSQQLVAAVASGLDAERLVELRDAIERSNRWASGATSGMSATERRRCIGWAEEARLPLLERLPSWVIGARRNRQVEEWRARQPVFRLPMNTMRLAHTVGSLMSGRSMASATDDQLMRMLDEQHDDAEDRWRSRRPYAGGARQLAQAFGGFAKEHPIRALSLTAMRLRPGVHEGAAGAAIRETATVDAVGPDYLLALIHDLAGRGFATRSWRNDAAWAMNALAGRRGGLRDVDIALLEGWIESDGEVIAAQVAGRRDREREAALRNHRPEEIRAPRAFLFGVRGGFGVVPQRNFSFLDAIGEGLLRRPEPDVDALTAVLLRHLDRPEDPSIWSHLLLSYSRALWWMREENSSDLLRRLLDRQPEAFDDPHLVRVLWQLRDRLPADVVVAVLDRWLGGEDAVLQAAGEYAGAVAIVDVTKGNVAARAAAIANGPPSPERTGHALSAAAAWREGDPGLRDRAHGLLMHFARGSVSDEAEAVATALSRQSPLLPDGRTRELLRAVAADPVLLHAAIRHRLLHQLQTLLVHPGFDETILEVVTAATDLREAGIRGRGVGFGLGDDMVHVAVALQRNGGPLRAAAMDLYECLLDAQAYGADAAAEAALRK